MTPSDSLPRYRELPTTPDGAPRARTTWGLFGSSDEVGTVNLLQPDLVQRATSLVRWGTVYPLNWSTTLPDPPLLGRGAYRHVVKDLRPGTDDYLDNFYLQASTHWNALRHVAHPDHGYYNGLPLEDPAELGVPRLGIEHWAARGIVGRFVLIDVDRHRAALGEPLKHEESVAIQTDELDEALARQRVRLERGDILLIRFGWTSWYDRLSLAQRERMAAQDGFRAPGLSPSERTAEWLWDHRVAAVASDSPALEVMPFDRGTIDGFLHYRLVSFLGMAVGGLFLLEELAHDCAANGVYEGLFVSAPMNVPGGSGSPANAIAIK